MSFYSSLPGSYTQQAGTIRASCSTGSQSLYSTSGWYWFILCNLTLSPNLNFFVFIHLLLCDTCLRVRLVSFSKFNPDTCYTSASCHQRVSTRSFCYQEQPLLLLRFFICNFFDTVISRVPLTFFYRITMQARIVKGCRVVVVSDILLPRSQPESHPTMQVPNQ